MAQVQISAFVSDETKARLDRYTRAHGVSKGWLVEQALLHHLLALEELPEDVRVPARLVLDVESAARVRDLLEHPPEPTEAMKKLFDDR
ncbi:MAG: ribbon-helix-helix protein, CopG family [Myxococcota bacterium]